MTTKKYQLEDDDDDGTEEERTTRRDGAKTGHAEKLLKPAPS
jgi:hypothetical protein